MLEAGVVVPSSSEWASPVVLVRKKDGGVRWCVDYRRLNDLTLKDAYPLPKMEECLDVLGEATIFSTLDLQCGYWQISVDPNDRCKTAFITRYGLYEYTRMPFGLCNAPGTFQRAMELVLRGFQWKILLIYLDDIIVLGRGVEQNLQHLADVFERLHSYGLKLKPKKCQLLRDKVLFLGHVVSGEGISPNPELIKDVQEWQPPTNTQQLQAFLGLCNYYRRFVSGFAELAAPLNNLLKKKAEFQWGEAQQKAFLQLKHGLTVAPVLAYPAAEGDYILDTDASSYSIGAVLSQVQWGEERVISYASNHLTPTQQRYCVTRRELLAIVKYTRQFRHFLLGRKFLLRTDHGSLAWLFRFKHPEGQLARWLEELSQYDFDIEHRSGLQHSNADALSRQATEGSTNCDCYQAGKDVMELPCRGCSHCQRLHKQWARFEEDVDDVVPLVIRHVTGEEVGSSTQEQHQAEAETEIPQINWMQTLSSQQLSAAQKEDTVLSILHSWKEAGSLPTKDEVAIESPAVRKYWLCWLQIELHQGVLYYRWENVDSLKPSLLLLVPASLQMEVMQACHDPPLSGHLGETKTLQRLRQSFHWYGMGSDLHKYIQQCPQCKGLKSSSPSKKAKLQSYQAGAPMDRLHLDILGPFPISSSGNKYILVIMDQFTRWVEAFPVPDQGAETTARMLVNNFLARFGAPLELHTDQGRNFESVLFKKICQLFQISKTRTTPYHPASNGQVERFNRTLLQMIRCYVDQNQKNWDEHLPLLTAAYRSAQNSSTGFSPNMLMLGREVHQPQELWLGLAERTWSEKDPLAYVHDLEKTLGEAHDMARQHLRGAQLRQKRTHDLRAKECSYNIGDLVYVKDNTKKLGFSPKLQPPWKGPCIIKAQLGPVLYEILTQRGKKVMHHDQLKPYTSDVIPAWVRRQRHVVLPQCQDVVPLAKRMTTSPTPTSDDPGSDSESKALVGPPKLLRKKGKRQVAARRRRLAAQHRQQDEPHTSGSEGDKQEPRNQKTLRGREVRAPARYQNDWTE
ncbi:uncharacterized protein LOC106700194 [Xiphophorus maculatus]|uniref:uncharacterized protein LOC106700194 n=1 Tax=Xiphophorus maculatus TaxID=8083 RepID=UPI000C6D065C|nr:uncharacterized protein LOC106700194 [Xiphophorus maculatus]